MVIIIDQMLNDVGEDASKGRSAMETLPRTGLRREDMLKRVARFKDLNGYDGGLPDSNYPNAVRTLYNVIGFQPPSGEGGAVTSPVGEDAARMAAIKISEGFNLGYCRAKPGKGPMMHNHATNETFIPMTGTWRSIIIRRLRQQIQTKAINHHSRRKNKLSECRLSTVK